MESGDYDSTGNDGYGNNIYYDSKHSYNKFASGDRPETQRTSSDHSVDESDTVSNEAAIAADLARVDLEFNPANLRRAHSDDSTDSYGLRIPQAPAAGASKHARNTHESEMSLYEFVRAKQEVHQSFTLKEAQEHQEKQYMSSSTPWVKERLSQDGLGLKKTQMVNEKGKPYKYYSPRATYNNATLERAASSETVLKRSDSDIKAEKARKLTQKKEQEENTRHMKQVRRIDEAEQRELEAVRQRFATKREKEARKHAQRMYDIPDDVAREMQPKETAPVPQSTPPMPQSTPPKRSDETHAAMHKAVLEVESSLKPKREISESYYVGLQAAHEECAEEAYDDSDIKETAEASHKEGA